MKILLYGATGMIGRGALLECLDDPDVSEVLAIVRRTTGESHPKYREMILEDFSDYRRAEDEVQGFDACLYCLGISAGGMKEPEYRHITYDLALAAGRAITQSPGITRLCFISGAGTDRESRMMWARVKAETEDAMAALSWRSAHMFRPAVIRPMRGVVSGVRSYRLLYAAVGWSLGPLQRVLPSQVTDTVVLGRALIRVGRSGHAQAVLENADINRVGSSD